MITDCMLTTTDNPFDPFTEFDEWNRWDHDYGYCTNEYLARVVDCTTEMGDYIEFEQTLAAMQSIVRMFPDTYKIVTQ